MNFSAVLVLLVAVFAAFAGAQSGFGNCQEPAVQPNFSIPKYLGLWYEISKLPLYWEEGGFCVTANYTAKSDGHVKVDNRLHYEAVNGSTHQAIGDAYPPDPTQPAKLAVSFSEQPFFAAPYWIVSTDYTTYAMVLSCVNVLGYRLDYAWILSRTPQMNASLKQSLLSKFQAIGVDPSSFVDTVQDGCKYN